ncbi:hypothetical protein DDE18_03680 [Nocardioides gansuensis]|uniref:PsbP C-terminal domain-containing protein n=2 Tax=Nocardioides gansuensis TaxID=2138300 RepID=A0A2T8FG59_9ACTN|nr:hypothetical protein DDE18_03680 [Nocardioides gansuensis]
MAATAACVVLLGGCTSGGADGPPAGVPGGETATTEADSVAPTSEPNEGTPSVEPADGKLYEMESSRFRLPKKWYVTSGSASGQMAAYALPSLTMTARDWPDLASETEYMAAETLKERQKGGKYRRVEDIELPICSAYQIVGHNRADDEYEIVVGCTARGRQYHYSFATGEGGDEVIRPVMESIFASMEWD